MGVSKNLGTHGFWYGGVHSYWGGIAWIFYFFDVIISYKYCLDTYKGVLGKTPTCQVSRFLFVSKRAKHSKPVDDVFAVGLCQFGK